MKARSIVFLFLFTLTAHSQSVKWENDLVVNYKMTDSNGKMKSAVVVKKDTIHYEWFEKEKVSRRMIVRDTVLENKLRDRKMPMRIKQGTTDTFQMMKEEILNPY